VVASESLSDPSVVIKVIVVTIVGLLTLMPLGYLLANRDLKHSTKQLEGIRKYWKGCLARGA
jgi:hypothetical protein